MGEGAGEGGGENRGVGGGGDGGGGRFQKASKRAVVGQTHTTTLMERQTTHTQTTRTLTQPKLLSGSGQLKTLLLQPQSTAIYIWLTQGLREREYERERERERESEGERDGRRTRSGSGGFRRTGGCVATVTLLSHGLKKENRLIVFF